MSDSPLRILLTVPHLASTASPYRETLAIAKYLPKDAFSLTICALRDQGFAETSPRLAALGVKSFVARFRPTSRNVQGFVASVLDQKRISGQGTFDIQHSLDFSSSPFEAFWARVHRRAFVYTQRNLNEGGHPFLLKRKIGLSNGVLAISRATESLVAGMSARRTPLATIPLGFDFEERPIAARRDGSGDRPVIVNVGHIQRRKRIEDAIRALADVRQSFPRAELWIVGGTYDAAYQQELVSLAGSLGLTDAVKFLGVRDDVMDLMAQASVLLHCAESEAFGWCLVEAMAAGLPVVAYKTGGPAEVVDNGVTGFLAAVGDYRACGRFLTSLLSDRPLRDRIVRAANHKARLAYDARTFAEEHASFYRIIGNRSEAGVREPQSSKRSAATV